MYAIVNFAAEAFSEFLSWRAAALWSVRRHASALFTLYPTWLCVCRVTEDGRKTVRTIEMKLKQNLNKTVSKLF